MTQWGLDALFNPAKRHMDDEKLRLQSTREEVGDNSGGKRIDLESGRVVIRRADDAGHSGDDGDAPAGAGASAPEGAGSATSKGAGSATSKGERREDDATLTDAQRRARERRRRAAR